MSTESKAWHVEYTDRENRTLKTRLASLGLQTEADVRAHVESQGGKLLSARPEADEAE